MSPPGPNSPCHCGSGRKYKKCCKRADAVAIAANRTPQSAYVAAGPTRRVRGTSLDADHPAYAWFAAMLALDTAAGAVLVAWSHSSASDVAFAVANLEQAVARCCATSEDWTPTPSGKAAAAVARAARALPGSERSDDADQRIEDYADVLATLNDHIRAETQRSLTELGVAYRELPDFGLYWYSKAQLSVREGYPHLVAELSVRLYPAGNAPGGLFAGRASLWGLSELELDAGLQALLRHDEDSDLDPECCLVEILREIVAIFEREGDRSDTQS